MKIILKILILLILILVVYCIYRKINCKNNNLLGTWTTDGTTFYEFDKNGKGALKLPLSEYSFKYEINNNKIHIDFESPKEMDSDYEYDIKDNILNINGINTTTGNYILTKQNNKR